MHVFGLREWPARSRFVLASDGPNSWKISGGRLHGLTDRSILAVYPPIGRADADTPTGHVRTARSKLLDAVVEPCAYGTLPAPPKLHAGDRCEPVYIDYGDLRLKIAIDRAIAPALEVQQLEADLGKLAHENGSLLEVVPAARLAQWLVRFEKGRLYVVPVEQARMRGTVSTNPLFGPAPSAPSERSTWLKSSLSRIARAENLKRLAASRDQIVRGPASLDVTAELVQVDRRLETPGQSLREPGSGRPVLYDGDRIAFRVRNPNPTHALFATLLFIDSGAGITAVYPEAGNLPDRLPPGKEFQTRPMRLRARTVGLEHMVAIAIRAGKDPVDFTCLEQESIERARSRHGGAPELDTPLGRLLQKTLFAQGVRGLPRADIDDYAVQLLSWETHAGPRRADQP